MKRVFFLFVLITTTFVVELVVRGGPSLAVAGSQEIKYLGEGVASYTIDPGKNFIVKRLNPLRFENESGPTYEAGPWERVWSTTGSAPAVLYEEWVDFGHIPAGCRISYQAIDDDEDGRINTFYIGSQVHSMPQGMVTSGEFETEYAGPLLFHAKDSIGMWIDICEDEPTLTPTPTELPPTFTPTATEVPPTFTPTATEVPSTFTPTATDVPPTFTPTATDIPSTLTPTATNLPPSLTPTPTDVPQRFTLTPTDVPPTSTPTSTTPPDPVITPTNTSTPVTPATGTPSATPTEDTPGPTITPTKKPRLPSCTRINFEVGSDVARAGVYDVMEIGGRHLTSWHAQDGWTDSGWIEPIDITFENTFVQVIFQNQGGSPITMEILNPAPNTPYGWMSRGMCHALEVAWPDDHPPFGQPAPEPAVAIPSDGSQSPQGTATATPLWVPDRDEPTPEPPFSGSLRD